MSFTKLKNIIFIVLFFGILVFPWIGGGILRVASPSTYEKLSTVETEKRQMQTIEWDNLLNTGESISGFVDDRIPFRYTLISWYKSMSDAMDEKYQVVATAVGSRFYQSALGLKKQLGTIAGNGNKIAVAITSNQEVILEEPAVSDENYFPLHVYQDVIIARDGWLFLYGENEIQCYQGTNLLTEEELQNYASKINQLQALCSAQGKELYIYIAPNKSQVYSQYMPTVDIASSYKRAQQLTSYVTENCSTPFLYPLTESLTAAGIYQTYYKYDSHWNHLGALYGTNALYAAMGVEQTDPSQWITGTSDADKYELYTYMGIPDDMVTHDDIEYTMDYRPEVTVNGLNTESMVCHTTSDGANDKKLCVIGDSFRVNMMPYLAKDFTSCTFCHRDYMNEIHSDIKNADIIVIEAVERYDYEAFNAIQRTINVLSN
ncbi:alginate O-acetyltransferase AlgX-related protein [Pseudobutyrivibrio sp.]|uniref:alginate O-acetyltransferase AlgX-related protein n=1 Tax=Pseudobutyrivibrio sp. TaxID=2014367 RepID=UPI001D5FE301|nr:hypothetical protein [Pseudobutyrivibrio sp.]MBE5911469.1 hypothetical protein [Pseudobutyrivibrio sp.]